MPFELISSTARVTAAAHARAKRAFVLFQRGVSDEFTLGSLARGRTRTSARYAEEPNAVILLLKRTRENLMRRRSGHGRYHPMGRYPHHPARPTDYCKILR